MFWKNILIPRPSPRPLGAGKPKNVELSEEWPFDSSGGFVVLDLETTGLSPAGDRVIEVAMIKANDQGTPIAYWQSLIHPEGPVRATHIHGITDSDVQNAPKFVAIADEIVRRLRGHVLVGHNVSFDRSFLEMELARAGWVLPAEVPDVCTCRAARSLIPTLEKYKLTDCASALGLSTQSAHRALGDAAMTAGLLHAFLNAGVKGAAVNGIRSSLPKARAIRWPDRPGEPRVPLAGRARRPNAYVPRPTGGAAGAGLISAVKQLSPDDFLSDSASQQESTYAELLLSVLEDGEVTPSEMEALDDLAQSLELPDSAVRDIKGRLLLWTARQAWRDDKISNLEKSELKELAELMSLPAVDARKALDEVEMARNQRLNRKTKPLPTDWALGEPLRVGDRVVFTGCDPDDRAQMEEKSARAGLKVAGSVTKKTKLLVTDYTVNGVKDNAAIELGIRRVGPGDFKVLLDFIQPMENLDQ